ncbi:MAG: VapC toxin family PIN domain ribonuclease [Pseudonocardiales bacterium]|nr:type II toxin-antitoxin system VapC family toxin [Actinomycetota bacterium]PZS17052.1 MAG: VapC toxin family PIN domain ribonuclease [Pseudonocardiales bacterium]
MIYLDSSALIKLVRAEDSSEALQSWIDQRADTLLVTSALARSEVLRAVRRNNHTDSGALIDPEAFEAELAQAVEVLDAIAQIAIDDAILHRAGALPSPMIRTLDAIHLASAAEFKTPALTFVTYDHRLAAEAQGAGIAVIAPAGVAEP